MSPGDRNVPDDAATCPLLGLAADPRTHFSFPHPLQRCHATRPPRGLEQARQASYCLGPAFTTCDRYLAWQQRQGTGPTKAPPVPKAAVPVVPTPPAPKAAPSPARVAVPPTPATPRSATVPSLPPKIVHLFREGDTLARIAAAYGLTVEQLVTANHLSSAEAVRDGQRLLIPLPTPGEAKPGS